MLSLQRNKQYFGGHNSVVLAKKKTFTCASSLSATKYSSNTPVTGSVEGFRIQAIFEDICK